jgi:AcrR family transcriptional regulator
MTKKTGRPPYEPNDKDRTTIKIMAAGGIPADKIAEALSLSKKTLYTHYKKEIQTAALEANAAVVASLFKQATKGNVTAAIFWLKTRLRWTEHIKDFEEEPKNRERRQYVLVPMSESE